MSVLLGNGNGTFQAPSTFAAGINPFYVSVADLNDDGKPDLLVADNANPGGALCVLLGNGNGTFGAAATFAAGNFARTIAVGDINGDGKLDAAVANNGSVSVLLGNGDGTFQPALNLSAGLSPYSGIALADLNGDGKLDLAVANKPNNSVSVLLGVVPPIVQSINRTSPPGPFTSDNTVSFNVTFSEPVTGVDLSDFSVAASGAEYTTLSITPLSGSIYTINVGGISGTGTIGLSLVDNGSIHDAAGNALRGVAASFQPQQTFASGTNAISVTAADVNEDGKPDLIVANFLSNFLSVLLGNGNGTFQNPATFGTGSDPSDVTTADVNGDGKLDLIVADGGDRSVGVLLGNGNGTFQPQQSFAVENNFPDFVAVADVNGDGKADLIFTENGNGHVDVLLGNGNGTFQNQTTFAVGTSPQSVFVSDVNGDGKADLVVANQFGTDKISVLLGNGNGTFQNQNTFATGYQPISVVVSDVNGDGKPDLIAANFASNSVSVLLGNGNGTFQNQNTFATAAGPISVVVSDVNGDGRPDLIIANHGSNSVGVLLGNGNGTFQNQTAFAVGSEPRSLVVSDVNGDGKADLIAANYASSSVSVLLGNTNGNFTGQTYTIVPSLDTISGTAGVDQITLMQDPDNAHIDWTLNGSGPTQMSITDPNGLTINGNGGNDVITLNYANGNPLPNTLHLNGTFNINGLSGSLPFANTNLDIERSTVYISYANSDPLSLIQAYLATGYNNGAWNGGIIPVVQNISATGYNADVIAEAGAANALAGTSTDFGGNDVWYEQGFPGSAGTGLPPSGSTFTSAANPNVRFTLQPYTANNVAFIPGGNGSVTLTLTNPASYGALSFLAAAASGSAAMTATLNFADLSTVSVPITVSDWFNGNNAAVVAGGRIIRSTSSTVELDGSNPRMYEYDYVIPTADQNKLLSSVAFKETNGNQLGIFAISGARGAITSSAAAANAAQTTAIGYADSADGLIAGQPANTIELKYTLYGDTGLTTSVGFNDFTRLTQHYNQTTGGTWDTGDFNYDGSVNSGDFTLMTRTYNTTLGSQATPAAIAAASAASATATSPPASAPTPKLASPSPQVTPPTATLIQLPQRKHKKHR